MKGKIKFQEFLDIEKKLEISVGVVLSAEEIEKSKKLLKLRVSFGNGDARDVVTNIKPHLKNFKDLENKVFLFVTNLEPAEMMGIISTAMILPGEIQNGHQAITVNSELGNSVL